MHALDLPETEAPHPGVSSGGVEVEGAVFVRASLTGNGSPSGRQLGRAAAGGGVRWSTLTPSTPAQILAALAMTRKGTRSTPTPPTLNRRIKRTYSSEFRLNKGSDSE